MVANDFTQTLHQLDRSSPQFPDQLFDHLTRREFDEFVRSLEDDDLQQLIDHLDEILDILPRTCFTFKWTHRKLQSICLSRVLLPESHVLSNAPSTDGHSVSSGGFSDVYKGTYGDQVVCVKKLRLPPDTDPDQAKKILFWEVLPWKRLEHPNIVPFVGVNIDSLQITSKWMPGGSLTTYINSHPDTDRVSLLMDVAKGLYYLHSHGVIHGDLKGPNILVDGSDRARITDFGLVQDTLSVVKSEGQSTRWTAPEVLAEKEGLSTEADVFSFGMVMVEYSTYTRHHYRQESPLTSNLSA